MVDITPMRKTVFVLAPFILAWACCGIRPAGEERYPLGRYADLKKLDSGKNLLEFNLAYNPACAFSEYYNRPIPPKSNALKAAIRAGEMDSHYH